VGAPFRLVALHMKRGVMKAANREIVLICGKRGRPCKSDEGLCAAAARIQAEEFAMGLDAPAAVVCGGLLIRLLGHFRKCQGGTHVAMTFTLLWPGRLRLSPPPMVATQKASDCTRQPR
jgi:hypothetical protein